MVWKALGRMPRYAASVLGRMSRCAASLVAAMALLASALLAAPAGAATTLYVRGGGDGHGIGMSQYGAYGFALHRKGYRFILAHYYQGTTLGSTNPARPVRVLLGTSTARFAGATRAGRKKLKPGSTYAVRPNADGSLTLLTSAGKQVGRFAAPLTVTGPGLLTFNGGAYHGALEFRPSGSNVQTVEVVDLEDYVRGVVSAEVPAAWPAAALKAQAVAARTYAITTNVAGADFDVYPDTRSQMYRGVAAETTRTNAAVAATRGQVVTYRGKPVVTYFFSSSGGHTENIENVWPGAKPEPWLRGVPDPYDGAGGNPYHRWRLAVPLATAEGKLGNLVKGRLMGIQVTKRGSSQRVVTASLIGSQGSTSVSGQTLQRSLDLLSSYASFTAITTSAGPGAPPQPSPSARAAAETRAVTALVPLVNRLVANSVPGVNGSVFPVVQGASVTVQINRHGKWRDVERVSVEQSGSYGTQVPQPGSYRVIYRGFAGPPVTVS